MKEKTENKIRILIFIYIDLALIPREKGGKEDTQEFRKVLNYRVAQRKGKGRGGERQIREGER